MYEKDTGTLSSEVGERQMEMNSDEVEQPHFIF